MKYKSIIITAIISVLLTSAVGVVAAKLTAKDIHFTSTNEEWNVDNVEDAMNDLYDIALENDVVRGTLTLTTSLQEVDLGFKPKFLLVYTQNNPFQVYIYNEEVSTTRFRRATVTSGAEATSSSENLGANLVITDTGFSARKYGGVNSFAADARYLAVK